MSGTFDVEATAAAALARRLRLTRFAGTAGSQMLTPSEAEAYEAGYRRYSIRDEPLSDDVTAAGEWQDAEADRLYDEPGDPLLDWDDVPAGYDPTWWKAGL